MARAVPGDDNPPPPPPRSSARSKQGRASRSRAAGKAQSKENESKTGEPQEVIPGSLEPDSDEHTPEQAAKSEPDETNANAAAPPKDDVMQNAPAEIEPEPVADDKTHEDNHEDGDTLPTEKPVAEMPKNGSEAHEAASATQGTEADPKAETEDGPGTGASTEDSTAGHAEHTIPDAPAESVMTKRILADQDTGLLSSGTSTPALNDSDQFVDAIQPEGEHAESKREPSDHITAPKRAVPRIPCATDSSISDRLQTERDAAEMANVDELHHALAERDARIADLEQQLASAVSARNDVVARSSDWLQEREELRGANEELAQQLTTERERTEAAEGRVRDLRRTAEESRRAIMRLQQSELRGKQRQEMEEKHSRRPSSLVGTLASRALGANADDEEPKGLRELRLVSPTVQSQETFPPLQHDEEPVDSPSLDKPREDAESQGPSSITGLFNTSLLPSLGLRKRGEGEASNALPEDTVSDGALRAEYERAQAELVTLHAELNTLQDQLSELREQQQASETMIKSLREYIVNSHSGSMDAEPSAVPTEAIP